MDWYLGQKWLSGVARCLDGLQIAWQRLERRPRSERLGKKGSSSLAAASLFAAKPEEVAGSTEADEQEEHRDDECCEKPQYVTLLGQHYLV